MIKVSRNFGFTLIELMVVTLVILVLTGGALTSYFKFNEKQALTNDARALVGEISRARTLASSMKYPTGCTGFNGVNFRNDALNTGVTVTTQCTSGNFSEVKSPLLTSTSFSSAFNITFLPGSGYLSTGVDQTIILTDQKSPPNTMTITVGSYGLITQL